MSEGDGIASGVSPLVDVVLEEPSSELASAELGGMLLRLEAPATPVFQTRLELLSLER